MSSGRIGAKGNSQSTSKSLTTKKLIVDEYRTRLKDSVKSLNENVLRILSAAKINSDDTMHKNSGNAKMADYYAIRNEMCTRATLMVKAADELLMLTNDIREFLILRDFNFLSTSIMNAEKNLKADIEQHESAYDRLRHDVASIIVDTDRELMEHFSLRH
ncbi:surfeit locus protein 5 subunit 22 of mediator complex domain-containing protein [Ditylenchus destructor]|uniref:Mediator of RNA polymerase II transcription subunit 22 n=1 Tax=Ditylenchus destructor TaxID=166010 RepID=A0AAD4MU67_9BILA|nr:surfeit locus protein 5 subunit 22 of mediator complex domain-containing protein [Ditylenchus destructor]